MTWAQDLTALGITVAYLAGVLILSELVRSGKPRAGETSQKVLDIGLALGCLLIFTAFLRRWMAVLPFVLLMLILVGFLRAGLLRPVSRSGRVTFRTVFLLVSLITLPLFFWSYVWRFAAAAGLLGAALGEALSPLGQRLMPLWRKFQTRWLPQEDESLAAMASGVRGWEPVTVFVGVLAAALFFGVWGAFLGLEKALWYSFAAALISAMVTAVVPPAGYYLAVPVVTALTLWWLTLASAPVTLVSRFLLGVAGSWGLGLSAWKAGALNRGGVVGGILVGSFIFGFGGWRWAILLLVFFVTASGLTHWRKGSKAEFQPQMLAQRRRGLSQVLANGAWGGVLAVAGHLHLLPPALAYLGFVGAVAAANADTWGTEVGMLSKSEPRLVTTGRRVAPGTSGAVSFYGTTAAAMGALLIGAAAWLLDLIPIFGESLPGIGWIYLPAGLAGGLSGALFDSWLGATWQGGFYCTRCRKETEQPIHYCGEETHLIRGKRWVGNDLVNFAATVTGSLAGWVMWTCWVRG